MRLQWSNKLQKRLRLIFWLLIPLSIILAILMPATGLIHKMSNGLSDLVASILAFTILTSIIMLLFVLNRRFYNSFIIIFLFVSIGFAFKIMHWPGAGPLLVLGFGFSIVGFIVMAFQSALKIKQNPFISRFGVIINIILIFTMIGIMFIAQHYPFGKIFLSTGAILFIISIISLFFTLPHSDYLEWTPFHKKFFYRGIVVPMLFAFVLLTLSFVFTDAWLYLIGDSANTFGMGEVALMSKEGL